MKVHAVLSADARQLLRGQSPDHLASEGQALLGKLGHAGLKDINLQRALRHGIVTGEVDEPKLAALRSLAEVDSVEIDGVMRAL